MTPRRILGLDILPGSSPEEEPRFAAAVLVDERFVAEYEDVGLGDLPRIVEKYGVEAIALDNLYELAPDEDRLAAFLKRSFRRIPRIIQTTLIGGEAYSIEVLCRAAGLCTKKPSPLETARINALLARREVGSEALLFEEETRITVSRGRQPGQGGMSRERYKRNIEMLVLRKTREIEEKLSRAGIDYDLFVRKSGVGLEGATFIVYARRERLYGIVRQSRGYDLVVELEPVRREKIEFIPLKGASRSRGRAGGRPLIVGVDPGMSTGIAILDLKGRPLLLTTRRWIGRNQLAEIIHQYGSPAIIATDVNPPPSYVKKLAASLSAKLFYPPRSLSVEEKRVVAAKAYEKLGVRAKDSHQRDALAAAVKAFQHYRVKLEQVEREAERLGIRRGVEEAKLMVIRGVPVSEALERVLRRRLNLAPKPRKVPADHGEEEHYEAVITRYRRALAEIAGERDALRRRVRELESELREERELREQLLSLRGSFLLRDREYAKLRAQIEALREKIGELEAEIEGLRETLERYEAAARALYLGRKILAPRLSEANLDIVGERAGYVVVDDDAIREIGYGKVLKMLKGLARHDAPVTVLLHGRETRRIEKALSGTPIPTALLPESAVPLGDFYVIAAEEVKRVTRGEPDIKRILLSYREERRREMLARRRPASRE